MDEYKTGDYHICKKSASAQFKLYKPTRNQNGYIEKEGAVGVEAAPATGQQDERGNNTYDWSKKFTFSFGLNDISSFIDDPTKRLVHEYKKAIKTLVFIEGKDQYAGTYMMSINEKPETGPERKISVPINSGEMKLLSLLIRQAAPKLIGW